VKFCGTLVGLFRVKASGEQAVLRKQKGYGLPSMGSDLQGILQGR